MNKFPSYSTASKAAQAGCFKCETKLDEATLKDAGYPQGRGRYSLQCGGCRLFTFFDVRQKASA